MSCKSQHARAATQNHIVPILTYHNGRLRFEYSNNGTFAVGGVSMKIRGEGEKEGTGEGQWNRAPFLSSGVRRK